MGSTKKFFRTLALAVTVTSAFATTASAQANPSPWLGLNQGSGTGSGRYTLPNLFQLDYTTMQSILDNPDKDTTPPPPKKRSEYPSRWTVAEFNRKNISNQELERFIEHSRMSDSQKIDLFKQADGDFEKYKRLKADWIYEWWRPALKQLIYYKILEEEARKLGKERRTFRTTQNEFYKLTDDAEHDILKSLLDQGKGIEFARKEFAKFLIESQYPHRQGESLLDTYFRWFKAQNERAREQIRVSEVNKSEFFAAHPKAKPNYFQNITAIYELNKQARAQIDQLFSKQNLTEVEIEQAMRERPLMATLIKKINTFSLKESSLQVIKSRNLEKYRAILAKLSEQKNVLYGDAKLARLLQYEQIALQLSGENTIDQLKKKQADSEESFMKSANGDFQDLMMARLYSLAVLVKEGANREQARTKFRTAINSGFAYLKGNIASEAFYQKEETKNLILSDLLAKELEDQFKISDVRDEYLKQLLNMATWVIKFDAKKLVSSDQTEYVPMIRDYQKHEAQPYLEAFEIQQSFDRELAKYRRKLKDKYKYSSTLNPSGDYRYQDRDAMNFIFD